MFPYDIEFLVLYSLLFLFCWWLYFGYLLFIFVHTSLVTKNTVIIPFQQIQLPTITVIIPTLNEESIIQSKLENLLALDYPKDKIIILFCDGGSTDKTQSIINIFLKKNKYAQFLSSPVKGKIPQLNYALEQVTTDLVVVSDADALLSSNALHVIALTLAQKKIGVVGLSSEPQNALKEEAYFWSQQNRLRLAESNFYSPLYIIATCYAFRNGFIQKFPEDVIADDIYMSFYSIKSKYKTSYTTDASVKEIRSPTTKNQLLNHKVRKTNALLHEFFRFFITFLNAKTRWQIIFFTRFFQATLGPLLLIFFTCTFFYLVFTSITKLLPFITFGIFSLTYLLIRPDALRGFFLKLKTFLLIHGILYYCLFTYPFYRQNTVYKRIGSEIK